MQYNGCSPMSGPGGGISLLGVPSTPRGGVIYLIINTMEGSRARRGLSWRCWEESRANRRKEDGFCNLLNVYIFGPSYIAVIFYSVFIRLFGIIVSPRGPCSKTQWLWFGVELWVKQDYSYTQQMHSKLITWAANQHRSIRTTAVEFLFNLNCKTC